MEVIHCSYCRYKTSAFLLELTADRLVQGGCRGGLACRDDAITLSTNVGSNLFSNSCSGSLFSSGDVDKVKALGRAGEVASTKLALKLVQT